MGDFVNRTTLATVRSVNSPDYPDPPWLSIDRATLNAINAIPLAYRKIAGDVVSEMDAAEKAAVDAAVAAALVASNRATTASEPDETVESLGWRVRALIELFNKRDNYLVNRISEIQDAMDAMKATAGNAQAMRDAIPSSWLATSTRPRSEAVQDFKDDINAGGADT